jgi:peptide/nickel transport system substrate-binding protein
MGQDPSVALLRLEKGEVDIAGDGVPPAQFLSFKNNPAYKGLMVTGDQLQTGYVTMKTTLPPFDNLKVRQAVNMAVNKDRIVRIINDARRRPTSHCHPPCPVMTRHIRVSATTRQKRSNCSAKRVSTVLLPNCT